MKGDYSDKDYKRLLESDNSKEYYLNILSKNLKEPLFWLEYWVHQVEKDIDENRLKLWENKEKLNRHRLSIILEIAEKLNIYVVSKYRAKKEIKIKSYKWQGNQKDLKKLHNLLLNEMRFEDQSYKHFERVFNEVDFDENFKPIRIKFNATELIYFIHCLMGYNEDVNEYEYIKKEKNLNLVRFRATFKDSKGQDYNDELSSIKSNLIKSNYKKLNDKKKQKIDELFKTLKDN